MKKLLSAVLIIALMLSVYPAVYASHVFTAQELPLDTELLLTEMSDRQGYLFEFQGKSYIVGIGISHYTLPQDLDNSWADGEVILAGQYYMVRDPQLDGYWYSPEKYGVPVKFYDKDHNLVSQYKFPHNHIAAIGYYNGAYYCALYNGSFYPPIIMKSTDTQNWEETDEQMPQLAGTIIFTDSAVAFPGTLLTPISYEANAEKQFSYKLGDWIVKRDKDWNFYLSNDNVYFVKIEFPQDLHGTFDTAYSVVQDYDVKCVYEYGDDIVIDINKLNYGNRYVRLTVPKQDIYAELESQKTAPYVNLNGNILGFEQTPVLDNDHTLVPMRFLFEQMGADVSWDNETQTATVKQADREVSFSVNSTSAKVNNSVKTMDAPARLINDKTMVPLRFLSEELGYNVEWDGEHNMAKITTD